jgi:hypothetical protein
VNKLTYDPEKLGTAEATWWRAHHEHNSEILKKGLFEQNMEMYALSMEDTFKVLAILFEAVKAHDERDWDTAINKMSEYYFIVKNSLRLDYDPKDIAQKEIKWWKTHDELENNPDKTPLINDFAEVYSTQFGVSKESLMKAAELRARATQEHDLAEDPNTPGDQIEYHWNNVKVLLIQFYDELKKKVNYK